jgi:LysM repeat protein
VTAFNASSNLSYSKKSLKIPKGGNPNPYIEEEQTTQWPKDKVQKDKQRSTKHIRGLQTMERHLLTYLKLILFM